MMDALPVVIIVDIPSLNVNYNVSFKILHLIR